MPLETGSFVSDLNPANPAHTDQINQDDSHMRLVKQVLKNSFPSITGAVTVTHTQINTIAGLTHPFGTSDIADGAITSAKIADGTIATADIADLAVTTGKLADLSVTTGKLADTAVTTAKVTDKAVTFAKMQDVSATARLLGRVSAGAGVLEEIPLGAGLSFSSGVLKNIGVPPSVVSNLSIDNDATLPNTKVNITADAASLTDGAGSSITFFGVSVLIDTTTVGANAMSTDCGARAASTQYFWWLISDGVNVRALGSNSDSAPLLPAGYTFKKLVGWNKTDASSNLFRIRQRGEYEEYLNVSGSNTDPLPLICSGIHGSPGSITVTWTAQTVTSTPGTAPSFAPSRATKVVVIGSSGYAGGTAAAYALAPNSNYGGYASSSPAPHHVTDGNISLSAELTLQASTIQVAASAGGFGLLCSGFTFPL
jgi:hypothetical protein